MKKRSWIVLFALLLCLGATSCSNSNDSEDNNSDDMDIAGSDWRTTGIVQAYGTITKNNEDTDVLVCVHSEDATFYFDSEDQVLYDSVTYPVTLHGDPWESFSSIDFADRNGDGNSDVSMMFTENDQTLLMVWYWDGEAEIFAYQPDESSLPGYEDDGMGDVTGND